MNAPIFPTPDLTAAAEKQRRLQEIRDLNGSLLMRTFETMLAQQRRLGLKPDDDAEYPALDREASRSDQIRKDQE